MMKAAILAMAVSIGMSVSEAGWARDYLKSDPSQERGFSNAVATQGGKTIWLSGHTAIRDDDGKPLAGDVQGQARAIFRTMDRTLKRAGGTLQNLTTITVYITDPRYLDMLIPVRKEFFPDGNFPASTSITVSALPLPGMVVEIQGVAVVGDN